MDELVTPARLEETILNISTDFSVELLTSPLESHPSPLDLADEKPIFLQLVGRLS